MLNYTDILDPISKPNIFNDLKLTRFLEKDFRNDLLNEKVLARALKISKPSIIFHMAAQSSVLVSYKDPINTIKSNVMGTVNVLQALRNCPSLKSAIIATTDKVYLNLEKKKEI